MKLSVVVLQYGGGTMTRRAVESFREHCRVDSDLVILDNGSPEHEDRQAAMIPGVRWIHSDRNLGFGAGNNRAASETDGEILLFLNNDTVTETDFAAAILPEFEDPDIGIVGPKLLNPDRTPQLSCGSLPSIRQEAIDRFLYRQVDRGRAIGLAHAASRSAQRALVGWVSGAAMFVRRTLFEQLGGFDEGVFLYFEDKDLCARARKHGRQVVYQPAGTVVHLRGGSAHGTPSREIRRIYRQSQRIYYAKHRPRFERLLLGVYQRLSR